MRGNNPEDDGKLRGAVTRTLLSLTKGLVEAPEAVEKASLALAWHRLSQSTGHLAAIATKTLVLVIPKGGVWDPTVMDEADEIRLGIDAMVYLAEWPSEKALVCVQLALQLLQLEGFPQAIFLRSRLR